MTSANYYPGLDGVIAGETAVSTLTGELCYRGYRITDLAEKAVFGEVAYLLLHGELPTPAELKAFRARVIQAQTLPDPVRSLLRAVPPGTPPLDVLRSAVSVLAHFDPDARDPSRAAGLRKAERLLGQVPAVVALYHSLSNDLPIIPPRPDETFASNFLYMLRGQEPPPEEVRAFDVSLTLYADHEFSASTFAARVTASTLADLHSAVVAAIGALKGPLHGGAGPLVAGALQAVGGSEDAAKWARGLLARGERVMGFGHRVCKAGDVRAALLEPYARAACGDSARAEAAAAVEAVLARDRGLRPNLDWVAGRLYLALGLEPALYPTFVVAARVAGWCAHVIEQAEHNRLLEPRARYVGPAAPRPVVPLAQRGTAGQARPRKVQKAR